MNRLSWLGLITAFGIAGAYGCSGGTTTDVQSSDATDIQGSDTAACEDGFVPQDPDAGTCFRAQTCDNSNFCPSLVVNNPQSPQFVIAQIDVLTPAVLGPRMAVGTILNSAIVDGKFFWGISLDLAANTIRTGTMLTDVGPMANAGFMNNPFHFISGGAPVTDAGTANRWDPVMGTITVTGTTFTTQTIPLVTVPIYGSATDGGTPGLLAELPLRAVRMHDVQMNTNSNCVGFGKGRFASCVARNWVTNDPSGTPMTTPYGVLEGDLTVADADSIVVVDLPGMPTLCGLIAGTGSNCSVDPSTWMTPAETTASGPGWHLVANFAAYSAHIQ